MPAPHQWPGASCPVCDTGSIMPVLTISQLPVHYHVLCATREEARQARRGDIDLAFCERCGHVFNRTFDPSIVAYTQSYENSLHFSPRFQAYARALADRLIERYDIRGKQIVEIGSGKGEFLTMLCARGENRGVGFDPSYVPTEPDVGGQVTFVQDFYSEHYDHYHADLICCRHVLEHIERPRELLAGVRRAIGEQRPGTVVFFEVPNVAYTLHDMGIWDLIYEHCSYFSLGSLAHLFRACNFTINDLRVEFGGQYLAVEALPAAGPQRPRVWEGLAELAADVARFARSYTQRVACWQERLGTMAREGQRAVVWGAGSKGVTFINTVDAQSVVEYVVDLNPRKHGMHVVGGGQPIVPPAFLQNYQPDYIIVMNPLYHDEIEQAAAGLGLTGAVLCA